jgi:deoxyribodipyrimidine photo-lyase
MDHTALLWFQKDLRVQDNACLGAVLKNYQRAIALVFRPKNLSSLQNRFYSQSVFDLRENLKEFNIPLFFMEGEPETEIPLWVLKNEISAVFASRVYNSREQSVLDRVEHELHANTQATLTVMDQNTLLHPNDYLFLSQDLPSSFTPFRKIVEENWRVRPIVSLATKYLQEFEIVFPQSMRPVNADVEMESHPLPYSFVGGESAAQERVKEFLWETRSIDNYKETRNGMLSKNDSSKFSPWLANGSLSARSIYFEIKNYENVYGANDSTYWLVFELLWRDYFKFLSLKMGHQLFETQGFLNKQKHWVEDEDLFSRWSRGETGVDFIDANMRELVATGWMSNRGRQNVASHFAKQLNLNWTQGANFFEKHLLDDDIESNWGNWQYLAGVGTDPRDRDFNIQRQADYYDPDRSYRNTWLT